ncbi:MAG: UDP-2,3-diacylglucosamine diphosphatase [Balneolales bacterium]
MRQVRAITRERVYLFISDAHLGGFSPEKNSDIEHDLISMIDYAESLEMSIIILGDLFDYWMEYPQRKPEIAPQLMARFQSFHQNNPGTLYITGNHDNWTVDYFKRNGFDVEPEYRILDINGKQALLLHGDGLSNKSFKLPRPILHRVIRNSYFVGLYKKVLPAQTGITLMRIYSRLSRTFKFWSVPGNPHLDNWAIKQLNKEEINAVICGHHHKPVFRTFDNKVYMNLGNFFDDRTAGIFANNCFRLVTWDSSSKNFTNCNTSYVSYNNE